MASLRTLGHFGGWKINISVRYILHAAEANISIAFFIVGWWVPIIAGWYRLSTGFLLDSTDINHDWSPILDSSKASYHRALQLPVARNHLSCKELNPTPLAAGDMGSEGISKTAKVWDFYISFTVYGFTNIRTQSLITAFHSFDHTGNAIS